MAKRAKFNGGRLVISLVAPFVAAGIGSFYTFSQITTWYAGLVKPAWNPPSWLFGPVWTLLYLLIGISVYLFWQAASKKNVKVGLQIVVIQLALNATWSVVFFGLHNIVLAQLVIDLLWLAIVWNIMIFKESSKAAAWLLVPYLLWVSFANVLNYTIQVLN